MAVFRQPHDSVLTINLSKIWPQIWKTLIYPNLQSISFSENINYYREQQSFKLKLLTFESWFLQYFSSRKTKNVSEEHGGILASWQYVDTKPRTIWNWCDIAWFVNSFEPSQPCRISSHHSVANFVGVEGKVKRRKMEFYSLIAVCLKGPSWIRHWWFNFFRCQGDASTFIEFIVPWTKTVRNTCEYQYS